MSGVTLIEAALAAPVTGIDTADPVVLHAVTLAAITHAWPVEDGGAPRAELVAPCGQVVRIYLRADDLMIPWPPPSRGPFTRCRACWVATGKKRPAVHYAQEVTA